MRGAHVISPSKCWDRQEVKVALSVSARSMEITDWGSELLHRLKMLVYCGQSKKSECEC